MQREMASKLYVGRVRHRRNRPLVHRFRYGLFMVYLDLADLDEVFAGRWLWSTRRAAVCRFKREDYLGDPRLPLDQSVRDLVEERTGERPCGPVRLLTNLRTFGFQMNPVSFYYCFREDDSFGANRLHSIVAEVSNTPWDERHLYVLPAAEAERSAGGWWRWRFDKNFHVSPFLGMEHRYDWSFTDPTERLAAHLSVLDPDQPQPVLDATLSLRRQSMNGRNLAMALLRHPFITGQVVLGIYWQALRLWWKRCPFHEHPKHRQQPPTRKGTWQHS